MTFSSMILFQPRFSLINFSQKWNSQPRGFVIFFFPLDPEYIYLRKFNSLSLSPMCFLLIILPLISDMNSNPLRNFLPCNLH